MPLLLCVATPLPVATPPADRRGSRRLCARDVAATPATPPARYWFEWNTLICWHSEFGRHKIGTNVGDVALWDVGNRERLILKNFKVWELGTCSMSLQASLVKDPAVLVNRIIWSPDGSLFGVAYSRNIVQIYAYHGGEDIRQHLEFDAHVGGVNNIAFAHPNKQLSIITCGDDKAIRVWDATSGTKQHTFEGHEAPVYSVCPHHKENIQSLGEVDINAKFLVQLDKLIRLLETPIFAYIRLQLLEFGKHEVWLLKTL